MRVIVPVTPTLNSSSVPEPDSAFSEVSYNAGTTYALGDQVISTSNHRRYESLQSSNTGHALPVLPLTQNDWWLEVGVTNRYAAMDSARNTQAVGDSPMTYTITPGQRINSIALMGMEADSATIAVYNGATLVYSKSFSLQLRRVEDAYDYFFKPFDLQPSVVQFDIPPFSASTMTVTLTRASGQVKLGSIVVGNYVYIGKTKLNAINDALNFSTVDRDIYGTATLVPRRTLPKTNQTLIVDKRYVNDLIDARSQLNAVPAVWSGLDDKGYHDYFEAFLIRGIYKQFSINASFADYAEISLELEEI